MSGEYGFILDHIEYSIVSEIQKRMAVVTPCLKISTEKKMLLIGSLGVDGHELLPSFRILLEEGLNDISLRAFKIIRPLPPPNFYRIEIRLSSDGLSCFSDIREVPIEIK
jgi:hypothetical protein